MGHVVRFPVPAVGHVVRQLGPQMLDGAARDFGADEGLHEVEHPAVAEKPENRFGTHVHDVDVVVDRSVFPGDQGQAPLEGLAFVQVGNLSIRMKAAGPFVDKGFDPGDDGVQVGCGQRAFNDDVAFVHEMLKLILRECHSGFVPRSVLTRQAALGIQAAFGMCAIRF